MRSEIRKAGIECKTCGYMLLVKDDYVFCQNCKKRVIPGEPELKGVELK